MIPQKKDETNLPTLPSESMHRRMRSIHYELLAQIMAYKGFNKVHENNKKKNPPLYEVVQMDMRFIENKRMALFLLQLGKDLLWSHPVTGNTPASYIFKARDRDLVDLALNELDNVDEALDRHGNTALYIAVHWERHDTMLKLLKKGANPNYKNKNERSVLHKAIQMERPDILRILVEHGGDINVAGWGGLRPIHAVYASTFGKCMDAVLRSKPDIDVVNDFGDNTLSLYIRYKIYQTKNIAKLLDNGSNPNLLSQHGANFLHYLTMNCTKEYFFSRKVVALLIEHGIDINAQTHLCKRTPLHFAIECNKKMVPLLLFHNADLTKKNHRGLTPLEKSIDDSPSSVKTILSHIILMKQPLDPLLSDKYNVQHLYDQHFLRCERLLEKLKNLKVRGFPSISYYDILTFDDMKNAQLLRIENFRASLAEDIYLLNNFSEYKFHLNEKIDFAFKIYNARETISEFLSEFLHNVIPLWVIEHIISFMDKKELFRLQRQI